MSFSTGQISQMLEEYGRDHHVVADLGKVAEEIFQYTSGYPYLVSAICKRIDEDLPEKWGTEVLENIWTKEGVAMRSVCF